MGVPFVSGKRVYSLFPWVSSAVLGETNNGQKSIVCEQTHQQDQTHSRTFVRSVFFWVISPLQKKCTVLKRGEMIDDFFKAEPGGEKEREIALIGDGDPPRHSGQLFRIPGTIRCCFFLACGGSTQARISCLRLFVDDIILFINVI